MLSDKNLAGLCAASYDDNAAWDRLFPETDDNPCYVAIKNNVVVFRGSVTPLDWIDDFNAVPYENSLVGTVEKGFNDGLESIFAKVLSLVGDDPVVCGHSLGAARALIFGGMLAASGRAPARVVGFGSPRPGFGRLTELLIPIPGAVYRNRMDPVTEVPVPLFDMPWQHPYSVTHIDVDSQTAIKSFDIGEKFNILSDHHIFLYEQGVPG